jgi:hypothetical protein
MARKAKRKASYSAAAASSSAAFESSSSKVPRQCQEYPSDDDGEEEDDDEEEEEETVNNNGGEEGEGETQQVPRIPKAVSPVHKKGALHKAYKDGLQHCQEKPYNLGKKCARARI